MLPLWEGNLAAKPSVNSEMSNRTETYTSGKSGFERDGGKVREGTGWNRGE